MNAGAEIGAVRNHLQVVQDGEGDEDEEETEEEEEEDPEFMEEEFEEDQIEHEDEDEDDEDPRDALSFPSDSSDPMDLPNPTRAAIAGSSKE